MRIYIIIGTFFITLFFACRTHIDKENYISSHDADSLVIGFNAIEAKDTHLVKVILTNPYDSRESFAYKYKGQTVYQAKMNAMARITGLTPPAAISYKPDSSIVKFYTAWAVQRKYLK